mmetsp:Transcript_18841/g.47542  ORF Transcript_18841/g.47542 Transcript_18841/m.47542 type:complete len:304 (-) Transcript_18841:1318-2229(-)
MAAREPCPARRPAAAVGAPPLKVGGAGAGGGRGPVPLAADGEGPRDAPGVTHEGDHLRPQAGGGLAGLAGEGAGAPEDVQAQPRAGEEDVGAALRAEETDAPPAVVAHSRHQDHVPLLALEVVYGGDTDAPRDLEACKVPLPLLNLLVRGGGEGALAPPFGHKVLVLPHREPGDEAAYELLPDLALLAAVGRDYCKPVSIVALPDEVQRDPRHHLGLPRVGVARVLPPAPAAGVPLGVLVVVVVEKGDIAAHAEHVRAVFLPTVVAQAGVDGAPDEPADARAHPPLRLQHAVGPPPPGDALEK